MCTKESKMNYKFDGSKVYFKFIFSVSIRILIEIFVFKLNKFSTLSFQYITHGIYYSCFP